jgi:MFS family permease
VIGCAGKRLYPPAGYNIHWSRLVDLPIAGLYYLSRLFLPEWQAWRFALAGAPLFALAAALYPIALVTRRLLASRAYILAVALFACALATRQMFTPLRIDHHGWQLALLALVVAGLVDPKPRRGGMIVGAATALSLVIGLEMLPYLAVAGAVLSLRWIVSHDEARRLIAYGVTMAGGVALGYGLFTSYDNRAFICDALTPVYLSALVAAGSLLALLGQFRLYDWRTKLALALAVAALLAGGFMLAWPQCVGRPEQISPALDQLWFQNISEAKPPWQRDWRMWLPLISLPVIGLLGLGWATWQQRHDWLKLRNWLSIGALVVTSCLLLMWQSRAAPAAQLLSLVGTCWLIIHAQYLVEGLQRLRVQLAAGLVLMAAIAGIAMPFIIRFIPEGVPAKSERTSKDNAARCPTLPALAALQKLPRATILTFNDLSPRLIAMTHHRALGGPYHRNGAAILGVQYSFRKADPNVARRFMRKHGATLLLICPGMPEGNLYAIQQPDGFYRQLRDGQIPAWLAPVPLPKGSPYRLWRVSDQL